MANGFSQEERVAFEDVLEGFEDNLILSKNVDTFPTDPETMTRANDTMWRPVPYQAFSQSVTPGNSLNFDDINQLSVPSTLDTFNNIGWTMNSKQLRDSLRKKDFGIASAEKLASDVNLAVMTEVAAKGSLIVDISTAAGDYGDIALADSMMNEQGVSHADRKMFLSSRSYNGLADDLSKASRSFGNPKSDNAYERSTVGMVSGFDTFKLDYSIRQAAVSATLADFAVDATGAGLYYVPVSVDANNQNVDNRTMVLHTDSSAGAPTVGDRITIAGVNAVNHMTKDDTGQLKTFSITAVVNTAGTDYDITITPPIISNGGSSDIELQYKNVTASPADSAVITVLNTTAADINPFFVQKAVELIPGVLAFDNNAGIDVMHGTTDNGIQLVMKKQGAIATDTVNYRMDVFYGVEVLNPEMCGLVLFGQV